MCSLLLKVRNEAKEGRLSKWNERQFQRLQNAYGASLQFVLKQPRGTITIAGLLFIVSLGLLIAIPKGFFPEEDSGRIQ
jgi:multidrug efflux pump